MPSDTLTHSLSISFNTPPHACLYFRSHSLPYYLALHCSHTRCKLTMSLRSARTHTYRDKEGDHAEEIKQLRAEESRLKKEVDAARDESDRRYNVCVCCVGGRVGGWVGVRGWMGAGVCVCACVCARVCVCLSHTEGDHAEEIKQLRAEESRLKKEVGATRDESDRRYNVCTCVIIGRP